MTWPVSCSLSVVHPNPLPHKGCARLGICALQPLTLSRRVVSGTRNHVWRAEDHTCHAPIFGYLERVMWGCQLQSWGSACPLPGSCFSSLLPRARKGLLLQLAAPPTEHLAGLSWAWLRGG